MNIVWLLLLVYCVKSIWGFCIGVCLVFTGLCSAEHEFPVFAITTVILGVILVHLSISW